MLDKIHGQKQTVRKAADEARALLLDLAKVEEELEHLHVLNGKDPERQLQAMAKIVAPDRASGTYEVIVEISIAEIIHQKRKQLAELRGLYREAESQLYLALARLLTFPPLIKVNEPVAPMVGPGRGEVS